VAHTVPFGEPGTDSNPLATLTLGDAWQWDRVVPEYPPSEGYALEYVLLGASVVRYSASTSSDGDWFSVRQAPATTAAYTLTGRCRIRGYVTKSTTERWQVFDGYVDLLGDPDALSGDQRTTNEIQLAAIRSALSNRLTADQEEVEINGRRVKFIPVSELAKLEAVWVLRVEAERSGGVPKTRRIGVAF
jgi:hypothetical protein